MVEHCAHTAGMVVDPGIELRFWESLQGRVGPEVV